MVISYPINGPHGMFTPVMSHMGCTSRVRWKAHQPALSRPSEKWSAKRKKTGDCLLISWLWICSILLFLLQKKCVLFFCSYLFVGHCTTKFIKLNATNWTPDAGQSPDVRWQAESAFIFCGAHPQMVVLKCHTFQTRPGTISAEGLEKGDRGSNQRLG